MVIDECESIICTDVIFAVINESFLRIQHIVYGFDNEARALYNEVSKRGLEDRMETSSRERRYFLHASRNREQTILLRLDANLRL